MLPFDESAFEQALENQNEDRKYEYLIVEYDTAWCESTEYAEDLWN